MFKYGCLNLFVLVLSLLEGTCGRHISITNQSGIMMTDNYYQQADCSISYQILTEHTEIKLTLLDQITSNHYNVTVCVDELRLHSIEYYYEYIDGDLCHEYVLQNKKTPLLTWVFPSTFRIVIEVDAPKTLMFEYKGELYNITKL